MPLHSRYFFLFPILGTYGGILMQAFRTDCFYCTFRNENYGGTTRKGKQIIRWHNFLHHALNQLLALFFSVIAIEPHRILAKNENERALCELCTSETFFFFELLALVFASPFRVNFKESVRPVWLVTRCDRKGNVPVEMLYETSKLHNGANLFNGKLRGKITRMGWVMDVIFVNMSVLVQPEFL